MNIRKLIDYKSSGFKVVLKNFGFLFLLRNVNYIFPLILGPYLLNVFGTSFYGEFLL
jgi:O-antigen/teichoic acid export membrane protein